MAALLDLSLFTDAQITSLQSTLASGLLDSGGLYRVSLSSGDVSVTKSDNGMPLSVIINSVSYALRKRSLTSQAVRSRTRVQFS